MQDRVGLEVFDWREPGQLLEGVIEMRLVVKYLRVDMLEDVRVLRTKIAALLEECLDLADILQFFPAQPEGVSI